MKISCSVSLKKTELEQFAYIYFFIFAATFYHFIVKVKYAILTYL